MRLQGDTTYCPQCGYDLRGQTIERCPECGFHYDQPALKALAVKAYNAAMQPYLDALPFLVAGIALSLELSTGLLDVVTPRTTLGSGLLFVPIGIALMFVSLILRGWVFGAAWGEVRTDPAEAENVPQPTWRSGVGAPGFLLVRLLGPERALTYGLGAIVLAFALIAVMAASRSTARWISAAPFIIGLAWTALASCRHSEMEKVKQIDCLATGLSTSLHRARRLNWALCLTAFLMLCLSL